MSCIRESVCVFMSITYIFCISNIVDENHHSAFSFSTKGFSNLLEAKYYFWNSSLIKSFNLNVKICYESSALLLLVTAAQKYPTSILNKVKTENILGIRPRSHKDSKFGHDSHCYGSANFRWNFVAFRSPLSKLVIDRCLNETQSWIECVSILKSLRLFSHFLAKKK